MFRTFMKAVLVSALLASGSQGFATEYIRGYLHCTDYEKAEKNYNMEPDDKDYEYFYARCLLVKGENDFEALRYMHRLVNQHEWVPAAFMIALYTETDGKFDGQLDVDNINKVIEDYYKVLFLINLDPRYPDAHDNLQRYYEVVDQMELNASYSLSFLYSNKFMNGVLGTHNRRLLQSPGYEGDRNENTYPEYNPYTLDSLDKMLEHGRECQHLPRKQYFNPIYYNSITEGCRLYADLAEALKPLEQKRLSILNQESCQDLNENNCPEYYEVLYEILDLVKKNQTDQDETLRPILEYERQQAQNNN